MAAARFKCALESARASLVWAARLAAVAVLPALLACESDPSESADAGLSPFYLSSIEYEKARLYNLVGRWYPESEIDRLRDPTLTPEEWCAREPVRISIHQDRVEVFCEKEAPKRAAIARVQTSTRPGELTLLLRASKDSPLRQLRFEVQGPSARVTGSPCNKGQTTMHRRFPEFEILTRQILGGRRCSQVIEGEAGAPPADMAE